LIVIPAPTGIQFGLIVPDSGFRRLGPVDVLNC
jgi:hypothetical protein